MSKRDTLHYRIAVGIILIFGFFAAYFLTNMYNFVLYGFNPFFMQAEWYKRNSRAIYSSIENLFSLNNLKHVQTIKIRNPEALAWSPDLSRFAIMSGKSIVQIFKANGELISTYTRSSTENTGLKSILAFLADNKTLVMQPSGNTRDDAFSAFELVDSDEGKKIKLIPGVRSRIDPNYMNKFSLAKDFAREIAISNDRKLIAILHWSYDVYVFETSNWQILNNYRIYQDQTYKSQLQRKPNYDYVESIRSFSLSPNNRSLSVGLFNFGFVEFDITQRNNQFQFHQIYPIYENLIKQSSVIFSFDNLQYHPSGRFVVTGINYATGRPIEHSDTKDNATLKIYDLDEKKLLLKTLTIIKVMNI